MAKTLRVSNELQLPIDAATETIGILAVKRAGKSNAAVVVAEEMFHAGIPWVAVDPKGDWWGVRSSGDGTGPGLPVLVFGGLHGDVPLEPAAGNLVAELIVEQRITCVLDVSEMSKADQRRFLLDFAERLYKRNTAPLHVFCEEADEYIPQRVIGEIAKLVGAFETLVKRGGFRGIGITLITQRSASLNKDVLTQCGTLIVLRTTSPQDRKAIRDWIDFHAESAGVIDELPTLANGEAWVFSPEWLKVLTKIRFRRRATFDSGATPTVGGKPARPAVTLADVDLAAIKEQMAETIERAKADDPKELRKRIVLLERRLAEAEKAKPEPEVRVETIEVPVLDEALVIRVEEALMPAAALLAEVQERLCFKTAVSGDTITYERKLADRPAPRTPERTEPAPKSVSRQVRTPRAVDRPADTGTLGKGERTILTAVAQYPSGVTREQLTVLTGYKRSSRDTYLQRLRQAGFVMTDGSRLMATAEGVEALGDDFEPLPTGAALRDHWLATLPEGERRILAVLVEAYPEDAPGDWLSEVTGYKRSSRDTYLQRLRSRQLVVTDRGRARASDDLF